MTNRDEPKHTPGPWEAYDPCYGTCGFGAMPCTPDGCPENHPVGVRCVSGPPGVDDRDIELETEADARLIAAAPELLAVAKRYEMWEARLIMDDEAWASGAAPMPTLTQELWDELLEIQHARNEAIGKAGARLRDAMATGRPE